MKRHKKPAILRPSSIMLKATRWEVLSSDCGTSQVFFQQHNTQNCSNLKHSFAPSRILSKLAAARVYNKEGALVWIVEDNFQAIFMAFLFPKERCPDSKLNPVLLIESHTTEAIKLRQHSVLNFNCKTRQQARSCVLAAKQSLTSSTLFSQPSAADAWSLSITGAKHQAAQLRYTSGNQTPPVSISTTSVDFGSAWHLSSVHTGLATFRPAFIIHGYFLPVFRASTVCKHNSSPKCANQLHN